MAGGFDIFSQPQGPAISVSLFGDAARTGAQLGQEIANPITAAIQGGIKGYQEGQQIYSTGQEQTIRQNQIDQIPVQNQIEAQRAEAGDLELQKAQNDLKSQVATQQTGIAKTNAVNVATGNRADAQNQLALSTTSIQNKLADPTLNDQDKLTALQQAAQQGVFSQTNRGKNASGIIDGPSYLKQQLATINPQNVDQQAYQQLLDQGAKDTAYQRNQQSRDSDNYNKSLGVLSHSDAFTQALSTTGLPEQKLFPNVELVDPGKYQLEADGKTVKVDSAGTPVLSDSPGIQNPTHPSYDMIYRNPDDKNAAPQIVAKGIDDPSIKKNLQTYQGLNQYENGNYYRAQLQQTRQEWGVKQQTGTGAATAGNTQGSVSTFTAPNVGKVQTDEPVQSQTPPYISFAQKKLGIDDSTTGALSSTFTSLKNNIDKYYNDPATRSDPTTYIKRDIHLDTIARTISDNEFQKSPALQAKYTQSMVDDYRSQAISTTLNPTNFGAAGLSEGYVGNLIEPFLPKTPQDLYYKQQAPLIRSQLDDIVSAYEGDQQSKINASNKLSKLSGLVGR